MATTTVTSLPTATKVADSDYLLVDQSGVTTKASVAQLIEDQDLVKGTELTANSGASQIGTASGTNVQQEITTIQNTLGGIDKSLRKDLSANTGAALIGVQSGSTVQNELDSIRNEVGAAVSDAEIASATGASLVGTASGHTVQEELDSNYGSFQTGVNLLHSNQYILDTSTTPNQLYRWGGTLPKNVPAGSTPQNTGGIGSGAWIAIGDTNTLSFLATAQGAASVGTRDGSHLQEHLDAIPIFQNRAAVTRAQISASVNRIRVLSDETGNNWFGVYSTEDFGNSTNIVSADGRTWMKEVSLSSNYIGTIVVFGSSTAGGFGTSDFTEYPSLNTNWQSSPSSWPSMLQKKLGNRAKIINRSIGGYTTQTNLDRFMRDVAPHNPDYVILCTGWFNEPGGDDYNKGANYIAGTRFLIEMCRHIGAQPILAPLQALGSGNSTAPQYDIARVFATENIPVIDLASFVMEPGSAAVVQGKFNYGDGVHTNSAAHALYAEAFDLGYFYRKERAPFNYQTVKGLGISAHSANPMVRAPVRMWVNRDKDFGPRDWTAQVTLRAPGAGDKGGVPIQIILEDETTNIKVRAYSPDAPTVRLTRADNTVLLDSGVAWDNAKDLSIAVSYQSSTDSLYLLVGTVTSGPYVGAGFSSQRLSAVHFGGLQSADTQSRMTGWTILAANVWRTAAGHTVNAADRFRRRDFIPAGLIASLGTEYNNTVIGDNKASGYVLISLYNTDAIVLE